jgi:predicted alpha/beta superfamily hydrolase
MKKIVFFLCVLSTLFTYSQKITEEVFSPKLNENREITIGLPASYLTNPNKKYPLLIVLDGDYLFDPFQGALNYGAYWDDLPEVIIVGINQNKNNERETDCAVDQTTGLPDEKGNQFFEFIGMELVSFLEKKYRIAPFKIIAGHDFTAGFLNFYLYKERPLFDAYISMSPELPVAMEKNIPDRFNALEQSIYYYQSTADGDVKKMKVRINELDAALKTITKPTINYRFDDFKGASHYSLVLHSIPNALYQFFSVYQPISTSEFLEKIVVLPSGYVDYLINKYDVLEKSLNIKMPIRINDFKAIEAAILKNNAFDEFDKLSELSKKQYPKTMLSDYHKAMFYEKTGDIKKAMKAYQSAFQKDEIGDLTKDMMLDKADELKNQE